MQTALEAVAQLNSREPHCSALAAYPSGVRAKPAPPAAVGEQLLIEPDADLAACDDDTYELMFTHECRCAVGGNRLRACGLLRMEVHTPV